MSGLSESYRYRINGVLDTSTNVLANMENLANSCASWISYDMFTGKWDVVINKPDNIQMNFNDSNIIGSINLNGSGLREMYNSVEVRFPHSDLNNQMDYIKITIPAEDRLPNEPDNTLNISYELLNDPVQAQLLGLIELKQARLDKIVTFKSDYSMVNLPAGAVISITNELYGWTNKLFRIVTIKEITEEGVLSSEITALEYDVNVYDTSDLYRYVRTNANGILTIGAIGKPDQPQVTKFETASRPGILIEAEVPGGVVSGIEYWLTYDVPPGVGSDENRNYKLIGTQLAPQGGTFTQGDTVELNYDSLDTSNFLIKVRGINGELTGPFSDPSGLIEYIPTQVTDAIGPGTTTLDDTSSPISGLLAANALMALLGELMNGSAQQPGGGYGGYGSIFSQIFDVFNNETGTDIVYAATQGGMLSGITTDTAALGFSLTPSGSGKGDVLLDYRGAGSAVAINADYIAITYEFNSGQDLDIRLRIQQPNVGQTSPSNYIGWSASSSWSYGGYQLLTWGGDNQGTGAESVLLNVTNFKLAFPSAQDIVVDCRAFWYNTVGAAVNVNATLYQGGTMSNVDYNWVNTGYTARKNLASYDSLVTTLTQNPSQTGDFISYFIYNIPTQTAKFIK